MSTRGSTRLIPRFSHSFLKGGGAKLTPAGQEVVLYGMGSQDQTLRLQRSRLHLTLTGTSKLEEESAGRNRSPAQ